MEPSGKRLDTGDWKILARRSFPIASIIFSLLAGLATLLGELMAAAGSVYGAPFRTVLASARGWGR